MNYDEFRMAVLHLDGVTYVGSERNVRVGVETDEDARRLRPMIDPFIPMFVTGKLFREIEVPVEKISEERKENEVTGSDSQGV